MGSLKRAVLEGRIITFIAHRRELPARVWPGGRSPLHSGTLRGARRLAAACGLLGQCVCSGCPATTSSVSQMQRTRLQEMQGLSVETLQESLRAGTASPHEHTGCGELPLGPRLAPGSAGVAHLRRQTQAAVSGGTCCPRPCPLSPPSFSPDDWALNPVYLEDSPRDALEEPGCPCPILISHAVPRTKG